MTEGYIKLHRNLLDKPIWKNSTSEQKVILITILLMANHDESEWEWRGERFKVKPGQFITSLDSIKNRCGRSVSTQNIRTALVRFEKLEFLTNESTKQNRLITICNWGSYQTNKTEGNKASNSRLTKTSQSANKELTTNKNDKNDKNERISNIVSDVIYYLNEKCAKSYKADSKENKKLIQARINEGYTIEDFKKVINTKSKKWMGTESEQYLRPETLFSSKHFESYLNEPEIVVKLEMVR